MLRSLGDGIRPQTCALRATSTAVTLPLSPEVHVPALRRPGDNLLLLTTLVRYQAALWRLTTSGGR